jgi:hypothetical protein
MCGHVSIFLVASEARLRLYGGIERASTEYGPMMRCNGTMNELAGTRIAASASSHARARTMLAILPLLLLLTSP